MNSEIEFMLKISLKKLLVMLSFYDVMCDFILYPLI